MTEEKILEMFNQNIPIIEDIQNRKDETLSNCI
jgi:hypothetical protein